MTGTQPPSGRNLRSRTARLAGAGLGALLWAGPAFAACQAPSPPDPQTRPVRPALPTKGPCVEAKMGTPGCLGWEPQQYNEAVKSYNAAMAAFRTTAEAYVAGLNAYVAASAGYARCEVRSLQ
jgi:hypothetical protein